MKMIILIITASLLAFIVFSLYQSSELKSIQIESKVLIKGSGREVFNMVKYLSKFPQWSPFLVQDPTQKYEIKGIDGEVGSKYYWNGNGGKDIGYQEITKIEDLNFISKRCDIQKPFVAQPTFDYYFNETDKGVEVKEVFKLESGTMDALFLWLFGAKAEMKKTNQQGLDLLKKSVEQK